MNNLQKLYDKRIQIINKKNYIIQLEKEIDDLQKLYVSTNFKNKILININNKIKLVNKYKAIKIL